MGSEKAEFKIVYDGTWYHNGGAIKRAALAELFAKRALKRDEAGNYWLQAPFEKYPVEVEDVPFVIVDYKKEDGNLDFMTNMDERVECGPDRPLELRLCKVSGDMLPYIAVRGGLYARLGRPVYYNLVQDFGTQIKSRGGVYPLGTLDE